jgi:phage-related protein
MGRIFKFVRGLVNNIMSQVTQQVNMIQDAVTSPLRGLVNQVMGGMWRGDGANRFVAEMTGEVIPMLVNIMGINTNFVGAIKRTVDRMEQAERQASSRAQQLFDVFNKIF